MSRICVATLILSLTLGVVSFANAAPPAKLPKLTGGGIAENNNSGGGDDLYTHFAFNAQATEEGEPREFVPFSVDALDYPAKGQVQLKNVLADDPSETDSQVHGEVVCIANLGPSIDVDGGGDPANNVWEIRFLITKLKADGEEIDLFELPPLYGSLFVQDNGKTDFEDESFSNPLTPECLANPFFQLEPVINGNIVVHKQ